MLPISIVIPCYNVEKYIVRCLDSILLQSFKEFELIVVDDGSTDKTLCILQAYIKNDSRLKIIHNEKSKGAGMARNQGMEVAQGEYIYFCDADDFLEENLLELAYGTSKNYNLDICIWEVDNYLDENNKFEYRYASFLLKCLDLNGKIFNYETIKKYIFQRISSAVWDKMFNRKFLEKNNILFQNLANHNDVYFVFMALLQAERIKIVEKILYHYRISRKGSITSEINNGNCMCVLNALDKVRRESKNLQCYLDIEQSLINKFVECIPMVFQRSSKSVHGKLYSSLKENYFRDFDLLEKAQIYFYRDFSYEIIMHIYENSYDETCDYKIIFNDQKKYKDALNILSEVLCKKKWGLLLKGLEVYGGKVVELCKGKS